MDLFFDLQVEWMALVVIIALTLAVSACLILVASHDCPFTGEISVDPGCSFECCRTNDERFFR